MLPVAIGFASGGLLLLTLGLLIRKGKTWLIAGYDATLVKDEKGLARWAGSWLMTMGTVAILSGASIFAFPDYFFIPLAIYLIAIPSGALTIVIGAQKYTKGN